MHAFSHEALVLTGIDAWLMEKFQVEHQRDWPGAPYCLLGEGVSPGDACWVHADPVWLRPDRDRLLLADRSEEHTSELQSH